ncbi:MAG: hypothetical protein ACYC1M_15370 [Armatimonadota bacterium]
MKKRTEISLKQIGAAFGICAVTAYVLYPAIINAGSGLQDAECVSNLRILGGAMRMYAQDFEQQFPNGCYTGGDLDKDGQIDGPLSASRNFEVNPDVAEEADMDGGCFGHRFYKFLMHVQLQPYSKNLQNWYCPGDHTNLPTPENMAKGAQSYQWITGWVYNVQCDNPAIGSVFECRNYGSSMYPQTRDLYEQPVGLNSQWVPERMLLTDRGVFGFQGTEAKGDDGQPLEAGMMKRNHDDGYNVLYFDGHTGFLPWGQQWNTLPATGWPPSSMPVGMP